jgi:heparin binding hemagglutinin HbhA
MVALPKTEDVRKAGEQAVEALRTPLLAALGAGDLATQAVRDAVAKTRARVNEGAGAAKGAVDELPHDLAGVREKLDPAELRKLVDEYTEAAQKLYQKLADQGEDTLQKVRTQPQVRRALEQLEESIATLQERVGDLAGDAREIADEVLAKVTRRTRSSGEKAARAVERASDQVSAAVDELGDDVAHEVRSTSRKAANRTAAARKPASTRTATTTRKTNGTPKK